VAALEACVDDVADLARDLALTTQTPPSITATSPTAESEEPSAALSLLLSAPANTPSDVAVPSDETDDGFTVVTKEKRKAKEEKR
jgi:hypothetical protein